MALGQVVVVVVAAAAAAVVIQYVSSIQFCIFAF
jgi:hypothetical protein